MLHTLKRGTRHVNLDHGLAGWAMNGAVAAGAGAGIGYAYGRYRDKWIGKHAPRLAAALGKLGAPVLTILGAPALMANAVDAVGQAGLTAMGMEFGLVSGRKAAGMQAVLLPASAALPAGGVPVSRIGELPPAPAGEGLSWAQLQELAEMH